MSSRGKREPNHYLPSLLITYSGTVLTRSIHRMSCKPVAAERVRETGAHSATWRREGCMILIYTVVVLILVIASWLIQRRVARLERKFSRVAKQTHQVALEPAFKPGTRLDACLIAKRQYQLGQLVQK